VSPTRPVLVADCVAKSYRGRRVLDSASLRAVPGEVRALFGRNGAGKSTLLRIAVGLLQPDSGSVFVDGEALERATLPVLARRGVMYLPDDGAFSSAFTLGRQLAFFARQFPGGDVACAAQIARVSHLLDRRPHQLSGGERRRAELAAALVRRPTCLVADEPYRGIAPLDAELLTEAFRALATDGCAVVVTGHEAPTLLGAADHVTWCTDGTTYELGPPPAAERHERFRSEYLGPRWWRASG
jgi:lipopolysaccharide export system ATP-binding protein